MLPIKDVLKARLKSHTDRVINEVIGPIKIAINNATDDFVDKMWPGLYNDIKKNVLEEIKIAEASKNKTGESTPNNA